MNKIGSFSNANGDGNGNVKTTTLYVQHTFLHDFDVRFSHVMFCGGRKLIKTNFYFSLSKLGFGLQELISRKIHLYLTF